jgi:CDP-diacylglycerol--glycerol-3-phosphate 3-phosphatidyltransferase
VVYRRRFDREPALAAPPIHPNVITAIRLPLAPIAVACLMLDSVAGVLAALVLALILEITDIADGWMARRYGVVSDFGKLFDPFSDAFCRFTLFLGIYAIGKADLWMILLIYYRDSSISFLRSIAAVRNQVLAARQSGKIKALVQGFGTQFLFLSLVLGKLRPDWTWTDSAPWWLMLVMTVVTGLSFVDYFWGNRLLLRSAWFDEPVE